MTINEALRRLADELSTDIPNVLTVRLTFRFLFPRNYGPWLCQKVLTLRGAPDVLKQFNIDFHSGVAFATDTPDIRT